MLPRAMAFSSAGMQGAIIGGPALGGLLFVAGMGVVYGVAVAFFVVAAALVLRLRYAHLPVAPSVQTPDEVERFARLMDEMPKPIIAFCRSGARSGKLFRAASGG